jgi:hypothetical protein
MIGLMIGWGVELLWEIGRRVPALRRPCHRLRVRLEHARWRGRWPWAR